MANLTAADKDELWDHVVEELITVNAIAEPLGRIFRVAFRRATIEHAFRVAKSEADLTHYEGRQ